MKKSVVILIAIIYLAAIFVVGILGTKITAFNVMVYITDIECINKGVVDMGNNHKRLVFDYNPDATDVLENALFIDYKVYPSDSSLRGSDAVEVYVEDNDNLFTHNGVTFTFHNAPGFVTVQLKALDGSNVIEYVEIIVI